MKRSRTSAPGLKHLAFFEALATVEESTPPYRAATAGLLALRLVDHWVLAGPVMVEPESVSVRSVREAIMAMAANDPQREVLLGLVNAMQTLREVDLQAIVPRIFAYAGTLERKGEIALAADAYASVVRLAEEETDATLLIDSHMRLGYCHRMSGMLAEAEVSYDCAGAIAKRKREVGRQLRSQIGLANVARMRGNLPRADDLLKGVAETSSARGLRDVHAAALHDQAHVAQQRGDGDRAVCLAYSALNLFDSEQQRERVLTDLGAFFLSLGRYDAARDALLIQEATAVSPELRVLARINLLSLAARERNEQEFARYRALVADETMSVDVRANFLIESARGFSSLGDNTRANALLIEAKALANSHALHRVSFEADSLLESLVHAPKPATDRTPSVLSDPAARVAMDLRNLVEALAA